MVTDDTFTQSALQTLNIEQQGLVHLAELAKQPCFHQACTMLFECKGKIAVIGIGKSGHIGRKISATLASVGFPAFFIHAAEALHGDLGMLRPSDCALMFSYSGSSDEITNLLPALRDLNLPTIGVTGNPQSQLARNVKLHLTLDIQREACPHNLAPTASTTAMLVLGDMLAMALLHASGRTQEDFARSHPAGRLGKRLRLRVKDVMSSKSLPLISQSSSVLDTLLTMSAGGLGIAGICDDKQRLCGVFTDGDLRRTIQTTNDWQNHPITKFMTKSFFVLNPETKLVDALEEYEKRKISVAFVAKDDGVLGALHMHSILRSGIV